MFSHLNEHIKQINDRENKTILLNASQFAFKEENIEIKEKMFNEYLNKNGINKKYYYNEKLKMWKEVN